jgi:hypothetical protein
MDSSRGMGVVEVGWGLSVRPNRLFMANEGSRLKHSFYETRIYLGLEHSTNETTGLGQRS